MKPFDATRALDRLAELANDTATGPRVARWLTEPTMGRQKPAVSTPKAPETQTAIRLPDAVLERADALAAQLAADPVVSAMGPPSRSGVLRLAIALGLEVLERDPARARPVTPPGQPRPRAPSGRWVAWLRDHAQAIAEARAEVAREFASAKPRAGRCVVASVDDGGFVAVGNGSAADTWRAWVDSWDPTLVADDVDDPPADPAAWVREYFAGFTILRVEGPARPLDALARTYARG